MCFGPILVTVASLRERLLDHQGDLVKRLNKLVVSVPRDMVAAVTKKYKEITAVLMSKPSTIEDVEAQRSLIESLPNKVHIPATTPTTAPATVVCNCVLQLW